MSYYLPTDLLAAHKLEADIAARRRRNPEGDTRSGHSGFANPAMYNVGDALSSAPAPFNILTQPVGDYLMTKGRGDTPTWGQAANAALGVADMAMPLMAPVRAAVRQGLPLAGSAARRAMPNQVGAIGPEISTRQPWAKTGAVENPEARTLVTDLNAMERDPVNLAKNVNLMSDYPIFQGLSGPSGAKADQMIDIMQNNYNALYESVPPAQRDLTRQWYEGANKLASRRADEYGLPVESTAGVYAALSPQTDWFINVARGDRLLDTLANQQGAPWSSAMADKANEIAMRASQSAGGSPALLDTMSRIQGKRLEELTNPMDKALWIRVYDEATNPRELRTLSPTGEFGDLYRTDKGALRNTNWASTKPIGAAVSVVEDPSMRNISARMGEQHKVRNFYNNIVNPWSDYPHVTSDTHNVAAGLLKPLGGSDPAVAQNLGGGASSATSGIRGTYPMYAEAVTRAASDQGVLPREMQSVTWEAIREQFPNKTPATKARANAIWSAYSRGDITQEEAQRQILEGL